MSHQIELEKGAYRFSVPAADARFRHFTSREIVVLALRTHANNVEPPDPCWHIVGVTQRQVCYDRELLPNELWTLAGAADGGMIKPNGRTCAGTAYVKQWRDALEGCLDGLAHCPLRRFH